MTREQMVTAEAISMRDAHRAADARQTQSLEGDSPINAEVSAGPTRGLPVTAGNAKLPSC
jgi:hypothetical protein